MKKVLVVEDNSPLRKSYCIILEGEGYQAFEASDGIEALAILHQESPIDLILSDGKMPRMDGYELIQKIRDNPATASIPCILITGEIPEAEILADKHLFKPVEIDDLILAVQQLLTG